LIPLPVAANFVSQTKHMKNKLLLVLLLVTAGFFSCSKSDHDDNSSNTNAMAGNWTVTRYDGMALGAPMYATYTATASSSTAGTANFAISFNGSTASNETDTYILSSSNNKVDFTKTGGNYAVLSGGGTWTINTLDAHNLKMTSANGLVMEMTK
jgi:hypothetical protein